MFAIGTEDEFYGGGEGAEPSDYELHLARLAQERELKRQVAKYGKEAMQTDPKLQFGDRGLPGEEVQLSYQMRMPGQAVPKKKVVDPLRSLMKQMGLKMGPDIIEATGTADDAGAPKVEKLPPHDDRAATPLQNPMKRTVCKPSPDDHGLCITTGFCGAWISGVSGGKTTCLTGIKAEKAKLFSDLTSRTKIAALILKFVSATTNHQEG